ncbi:MAG: FAD-dependent oxidoreductase [Actinomycetota bacterium]
MIARSRFAATYADAAHIPLWLDRPRPFDDQPALKGDVTADLVVVGGGFTGLWTALLAKEADPGRDVLLLEQREVANAATGRNGGFCAATLTHGLGNGAARWPDQMPELERQGAENLAGIEDTVHRYGIDCDWRHTGELILATQPWQLEGLRQTVEHAATLGRAVQFLDRDEVAQEVRSPTYLGGFRDVEGAAMVDPARLAWGLTTTCLQLGVRIHEHTAAIGLEKTGAGVLVRTRRGNVRAAHVALGTNVFPSLVRRVRPYVVPVYDYVLATEPIAAERWAEIGWETRTGLADAGNRFHYYSRTDDGRIVWGGFDAIYHYGNGLRPEHEQRATTFELLAEHFFETFPQLVGTRFSHTWGGAIDTCTRFSPFFGTALGGRVAYALGYTGMGVGASRFGASVMLDKLAGARTERTRLELTQRKPVPFPPEPIRWAGITLTKRALAHADEHGGARNLWLRTLDRFGVGFDS